tara:strand:+ start:3130 stop:3759 length:630 start_codon:yes stop_codon:yes gene_type:complete
MDDLIILVPSYNEKKNLKKFISKKYNFLILDDCSSDKTMEYFSKRNINIIKNNKRLGYEKNILNGINYVKNKLNKKYIITMDGDGEHSIKYIKKIYNLSKKNNFDLIVCNRSRKNRFMEHFVSFIFNLKFKIKDPFCGMKIYKTHHLYKVVNKISDKYFLAEILYLFHINGRKISNFNIKSNKKKDYSKIGNNFNINKKIFLLLKFCIK